MRRIFATLFVALFAAQLFGADAYFGTKPGVSSMHATTNYFIVVLGDSTNALIRKTSPSDLVSILRTIAPLQAGSQVLTNLSSTGVSVGGTNAAAYVASILGKGTNLSGYFGPAGFATNRSPYFTNYIAIHPNNEDELSYVDGETGRAVFGLRKDHGRLTTSSRQRLGNVARITFAAGGGGYSFRAGKFVTISGLGGSGYNGSALITTVIDSFTFEYANTGSNEGVTSDTGGTITFVPDHEILYIGSVTNAGVQVTLPANSGNQNYTRFGINYADETSWLFEPWIISVFDGTSFHNVYSNLFGIHSFSGTGEGSNTLHGTSINVNGALKLIRLNPTDGQALVYNSSMAQWTNGTVSGGGSTPGGLNGMPQFNFGGAALGGMTNAYWDPVNFRLGLGLSSTPSAQFHLHSSTEPTILLTRTSGPRTNKLDAQGFGTVNDTSFNLRTGDSNQWQIGSSAGNGALTPARSNQTDIGSLTAPVRDKYVSRTSFLNEVKFIYGKTASRALVLDANTNITTAGGTPDGTKFLRDDGVYAAASGGGGSPSGADGVMQISDGGTFGGKTNLMYLTNVNGGIIKMSVNGNNTPSFQTVDYSGAGFGSYLNPRGLFTTNVSLLLYAGASTNGVSIDSLNNGDFNPVTHVKQNLGIPGSSWKTGYLHTVHTTNLTVRGGSPGTSKALVDDGSGSGIAVWGAASVFAAGNAGAVQFNEANAIAGTNDFNWDRTNLVLTVKGKITASNYVAGYKPMTVIDSRLVADGNLGGFFSNTLAGASSLSTNIVVTNIADGATVAIKVWPTNGLTASLVIGAAQPPAAWYVGNSATAISSNGWNWIYVSREGGNTNISIIGPLLSLASGAGINQTTNFANNTITIASTLTASSNNVSLGNITNINFNAGGITGQVANSTLTFGSVSSGGGSLTTNIASHVTVAALTTTNFHEMIEATFTQIGTNKLMDGKVAQVFTNQFGVPGVTNIIISNLLDRVEYRIKLWVTNGAAVNLMATVNGSGAGGLIPASWYRDGSGTSINSNGPTEIRISQWNGITNLTIETPSYGLTNGTAISFATNDANRTITISATRVGVYRTIYVDAAAMVSNITAGATFSTEESQGAMVTTNKMLDSYIFDGSTSNSVQFKMAMPLEWDLSTIKVKLWTWSTNNIATVTNIWGIQAVAVKNSSVITNLTWGTEQNITNVVSSDGGAAHLTNPCSALTVGNTPAAAGNLVLFRVRRLPGNADDNDGGQQKLLGAWIQYKESATEPSAW